MLQPVPLGVAGQRRVQSTAMRCGSVTFLTVVLVLWLAACGGGGSSTARDAAVAVACDQATALAAIDRLGKQKFPDNPSVTWSVLGQVTQGLLLFVEVEPTPDEVGYPKFVFAIGCTAATEPKVYGVYAFENGGYILLSTTDDAPALPTTPP
jgi:hypothetical protein